MESFSDRLKLAREKAGITQTKLANLIAVTSVTVWRWEKGIRSPDATTLPKIAKALGTTVSYLIGEAPDPIRVAPLRRDYDLVEIPVVSRERTACCGEGISALDETNHPEEAILISRRMLGRIDDLCPPYAERTDGSSMTNYGIPSESMVVINPGEEVLSGDIALVSLGEREAIKAVIFKPDIIELHSDKQTITVTREDLDCGWFQIKGKIVAVVSTPKHGL